MAGVITRDYFKQLVKEHWDADYVYSDLKRQGYTIEGDEDAVEEVAKRNAEFEQDKSNPDGEYNSWKNTFWEGAKNVVWGLFSSANGFRDFAGNMWVEAAAKVAEFAWADKWNVSKAKAKTKKELQAPTIWDKNSSLYQWAEAFWDLAQVIAPVWWAGKVVGAIDKAKTASKFWRAAKFVAKKWVEWAVDMAKYKAVADEELATPWDLAAWAVVWAGIWTVWEWLWLVWAWVNSVGKAITQKLPKKLMATALKLSPSEQRKFMSVTGSNWKSPYDWLLERWISGTDETIAEQLGVYAKTNKKALDKGVGAIKWKFWGKEYADALEFLKWQFEKNPFGNEKTMARIEKILPKLQSKQATASDLLEAKRIFDKSTSIFNVTWDVGSGLQKQGLANVRSQIKKKLEIIWEKYGVDVKSLSKEIQLANSLKKWLDKRTNVTTNNNALSLTDWFGMSLWAWVWWAAGWWDPSTYIAWIAWALAAKKIFQNPKLQTKLAVSLSKLPKIKQSQILQQTEKGGKLLRAAINAVLASDNTND